uniref:Exonuclease domain-containing protein n=1 Tax=Acrobeloides nanus TaxID=290746 RepID=A0A914EEQ8_9BILA
MSYYQRNRPPLPHKRDIVALDCEFIGIGRSRREGGSGQWSAVAKITIVNGYKDIIYDRLVREPNVPDHLIDYRTHITGLEPGDLDRGVRFLKMRRDVARIIEDKIVVGHAIKHDFDALNLGHPEHLIRDTARYFQQFTRDGQKPRLKDLSWVHLHKSIQEYEHDSAEDALAALSLYLKFQQSWENDLA